MMLFFFSFIHITLLLFQYFMEAGAIAVRRVRKEDMRHVAKATSATMVILLSLVIMVIITLFYTSILAVMLQGGRLNVQLSLCYRMKL